ncbi:MAG: AAA family ATPase [Trichocoleus desertorum ATA4-8-CV12]|jgi:DNA sulfur modification protein DndD|nr:AAA family ATPase [Trichocoleus desertorum ATA4-8-CV12]
MKLTALRLCNFRQFYGQTPEILLARADDRNVTMIHGNNGSGKTGLLNAFTWVLFERFTAAFASPEQLVNQRAIAEAKSGDRVECWVEIAFEHDGKRYRVKRQINADKRKAGVETSKSELFLLVAGDDGRWSSLPASQQPEDVISRILPKSLHQYFFFDGERIEQIVRSNNRAEIAEATKKLLGVEVLDRAIKHLNNARKTLEQELESIGDAETKSLLGQKRQRSQEIEQLETRQAEIEQELIYQAQLKQEYSQRLRELSEVAQLQRQRDTLAAQQQEIRDRLQQSKAQLKRSLSTQGYTVFLSDVTAQLRSLVKEREGRGELPADIKQKFVQDLLDRQRCICGTELHAGTAACAEVKTWLDRAGLADVEAAVYRIEAQADEIDKQAVRFWEETDHEQANINKLKIALSNIEEQLEEIREQLSKNPSEDIRQLQGQLDKTERRTESLNVEKGTTQQQIKDRKTEVDRLAKQIKERKLNEGKQKLAQRRITTTQDASDRLMQVKLNQDTLFRQQLQQRLEEIFGQISFKAQVPRLSDKYELNLVETIAGQEVPVAASTGENQILSLSFIGSIIDRVRQWSKSGLVMGPDSSTFPLVMDSPFGSLDEIYRRQVAKLIPELANQLVVLVTKTQWRGEVADEMQPRIGREYVLVYNSPKPDCELDAIRLGSETYPLVRQSPNEFEYTEILEVNHSG